MPGSCSLGRLSLGNMSTELPILVGYCSLRQRLNSPTALIKCLKFFVSFFFSFHPLLLKEETKSATRIKLWVQKLSTPSMCWWGVAKCLCKYYFSFIINLFQTWMLKPLVFLCKNFQFYHCMDYLVKINKRQFLWDIIGD